MLTNFGFARSNSDYYLFTLTKGSTFTTIIIYVDDILISGNDPHSINVVKKYLHSLFTIKDMGEAKFFLGIELHRDASGVTL